MDDNIIEIKRLQVKLNYIHYEYLKVLAMIQKAVEERKRSHNSQNNSNINTITKKESFILTTAPQCCSELLFNTARQQWNLEQSNLSRLMLLHGQIHDSNLSIFDSILDKNRCSDKIGSKEHMTAEFTIPHSNVTTNIISVSRDNVIAPSISSTSKVQCHGDINDCISNAYSFDINRYVISDDDCKCLHYPNKAFLVSYCNAVALLLSCYYLLIVLVPSVLAINIDDNNITIDW